jgi:hypothetical protein
MRSLRHRMIIHPESEAIEADGAFSAPGVRPRVPGTGEVVMDGAAGRKSGAAVSGRKRGTWSPTTSR